MYAGSSPAGGSEEEMDRKCEECKHLVVCRTYHDFWETINKNSDVLVWDESLLPDIKVGSRPPQAAVRIFEAVALSCTEYLRKENDRDYIRNNNTTF